MSIFSRHRRNAPPPSDTIDDDPEVGRVVITTSRLDCEELEPRTVPAATIVAAFGAAYGGGPEVTVLFDDNTQFSFFAFDPSFRGGATAVTADLGGGSVADVVVGDGPGGPPDVAVFSGSQLAAGVATATARFAPFAPDFRGGMSVAVGPVNDTGYADVVVGAGPGGGPQVEVYDGADLARGDAVVTANFFAFPTTFRGGVVVADGSINGTSHADVVVGARSGGGPQVEVFDGARLASGAATVTASFFAFAANFRGGVSLAVGNVNGSGHADVAVGTGPGGTSEVKVFEGSQLAQGQAVTSSDFYPFAAAFKGGVQVILTNPADGSAQKLIVVAGPGGGPEISVYDTRNFGSGNYNPYSFYAFYPGFFGGVFLGYPFFGYGFGYPYGGYGYYGTGYGYAGYGSSSGPAFGGVYTAGPGYSGYPGVTGYGYSGGGGYYGSGYYGSTGGFSGGGFSGGGFSGGGFSGGSGGSSLRAAGGPAGRKAVGGGLFLSPGMITLPGQSLATSPGGPAGALQLATDEALNWWIDAGITAAQVRQLDQTPVVVTSLGPDALGHRNAQSISVSSTAAGYGWFVESGPPATTDFGVESPNGLHAAAGTPAAAEMDLTTVIAHEMGHALGLEHSHTPGDVMDPFLPAGVRRPPSAQDAGT